MKRILAIIAILAMLAKFDAVAHHQGEHGGSEADVAATKKK